MNKICNTKQDSGRRSRRGRSCAVAALAGLLLWSACTKDDEIVLRVNVEKYRTADKTYVDTDLVTCWSPGDAVVVNGEQKSISISTINDQQRCQIASVTYNGSGYWSFYPASIASSSSYSSGTISGLTLPATQPYTTDAQGRQLVPTVMAAHIGSGTGTMNYYNACIALQLTLSNDYSRGLNLSQLVVKDDQAPLCGPFSTTGVNTAAPALAYAGSTVDENHKSVTMTFGDGGLRLESGHSVTLIVILPPTDGYQDNKFTIEVTADDHDQDAVTVYEFSHQQAAGASGCFSRNQLAPVSVSLNSPYTLVLKGKGTSSNPYQISTIDDLRSMQNLVAKGYEPVGGDGEAFASACYRLMNNINFTSSDVMQPIGTAANNFVGQFDGQNHTLTSPNLTTGLFGYISHDATVKDLTVAGATVDMTNATAGGVICAHADQSILNHCQVTGTVSFTNMPSFAAYVGGIVGTAEALTQSHSTVLNCHCGAAISVSSAASCHRVGGIAGHLLNSSLLNSYTNLGTGYVISAASACAGGIVGRMDGTSYVLNCYFGLNDNLSAGEAADICGEINGSSKISNCYYRGQGQLYARGNAGVDNVYSCYRYDATGGYRVDGTHVGTRLNNAITSTMQNSGWLRWTALSTGTIANAPEFQTAK